MNNKKIGNSFEAELCEILSQHGFWAHNLAQNAAGQPADIIAVKNGVPFLIDCKVCSGKSFSLSRIEENQSLSMSLWWHCKNGDGWFAVKFGKNIYMVTLGRLLNITAKNLTEEFFKEYAQTLDKWLVVSCP